MNHVCTYPHCPCPFDAPGDPMWCARRLPTFASALMTLKHLRFTQDEDTGQWTATGEGCEGKGVTPERAHEAWCVAKAEWIKSQDRATPTPLDLERK